MCEKKSIVPFSSAGLLVLVLVLVPWSWRRESGRQALAEVVLCGQELAGQVPLLHDAADQGPDLVGHSLEVPDPNYTVGKKIPTNVVITRESHTNGYAPLWWWYSD